MTKPTVASIRKQMIKLERELHALAKLSPPERALKLGRAEDLLIEARACDLHRLR